jgi:hypothetical protein
MTYPTPLQVEPPEDQPQIAQSVKRPRLVEDDQVEQPIVVARIRGEWQAQRIARQIEQEHRRPGQRLLVSGVFDLDRQPWKAVFQTRAHDRLDVRSAVRAPHGAGIA